MADAGGPGRTRTGGGNHVLFSLERRSRAAPGGTGDQGITVATVRYQATISADQALGSAALNPVAIIR